MRLGLETGFDSGSTLDYVYRNQAAGVSALGRLIDRDYLDSIGWRGIRVRKQHLERAIEAAAARLRAAGRAVRIVDIAAGHGRYVLEALQRLKQRPESILLRDYSDLNVREGGALIAAKGLGGIARFVNGDAFDEQSSPRSRRPGQRWPSSPDSTSCFRTTDCVSASLAGPRVRGGSLAAFWSTPASPGIRSSNSSRARLTSHRGHAGLDHASAHAGRNGPLVRARRLRKTRAMDRRVGNLHGEPGAPRLRRGLPGITKP